MRYASTSLWLVIVTVITTTAFAQQDIRFDGLRRNVAGLVSARRMAEAFGRVSREYSDIRKEIADSLEKLAEADLARPEFVNKQLQDDAARLGKVWELGLNVCVADQDARAGGSAIQEDDKVLWVVNGKAVGRQLLGTYHLHATTAADKRPRVPALATKEKLVSALRLCEAKEKQDVAGGAVLVVIAEFKTDAAILGKPNGVAVGSDAPDSFVAAVIGSDGKSGSRFVPLSILRSRGEKSAQQPDINAIAEKFGRTVDALATSEVYPSILNPKIGGIFDAELQNVRAATLDRVGGIGARGSSPPFPLYEYGTWVIAPAAKLWLVPFEAMVVPRLAREGQGRPNAGDTNDSTVKPYVINSHRVFYVVSGRELLVDKRAVGRRPLKQAMVVESPQFNGRRSAMPPQSADSRDRAVSLNSFNASEQVSARTWNLAEAQSRRAPSHTLVGAADSLRAAPTLQVGWYPARSRLRWSTAGGGYGGCVPNARFVPFPPNPSKTVCGCGNVGGTKNTAAILGCQLNNGYLRFDENADFAALYSSIQKAIKDEGKVATRSLTPDEQSLRDRFGAADQSPPDILAFTTHGCYLTVSAEVPDAEKLSGSLLALDAANIPPKSALNARSDAINGILNGQEVVQHFNLDGTQLTMLIGCETGKGAIDGDSVAALRHAFVMAMADRGSVIATSWSLETSAAKEWISTFAREYFSSKGKDPGFLLDAMRSASLAVQKNPKWNHPLFWAPFLLTGNPIDPI